MTLHSILGIPVSLMFIRRKSCSHSIMKTSCACTLVTLIDCTFTYRNPRCKGIICSTAETFVVIDHQQRVILYDFLKGRRWPLPLLEDINSAIPIHRNTGFAAGGQGAAHVVDIKHSLITQVLKQSKGCALAKGCLIRCFQVSLHSKKTSLYQYALFLLVEFSRNYLCLRPIKTTKKRISRLPSSPQMNVSSGRQQ